MSQRQLIVLIGVWVIVYPFLGVPSSWFKIIGLLTGLVVIAFAYRIRFRDSRSAETFSDSRPSAPAAPVLTTSQETPSALNQ